MKTLVLYVFHEECHNLDTFIKRGLIDSSDIDFIFVCNNINPDLEKWKFLDSHDNVHLFVRPNIGHDFQGWNEALFLPVSSLQNKIIHSLSYDSANGEQRVQALYDRFIFLNSTVTGPYLPLYVDKNWVECFTSKLSDEVKMVGICINFISGHFNQYISDLIKTTYGIDSREHTHVQSMAYALDLEGIDILFKHGLFKEGKQFPHDKWNLVISSEIAMGTILRHEKKSLYSYFLEQGLIKYNEVSNFDNPWVRPGVYPVCETIFTKNTCLHTPGEQPRYDSPISLTTIN